MNRSAKGEQLTNKEVPLPEQQQIDPRFLVRVIGPHQPSRGDTATERQTGPVHQTAATNGLRPSEDLWLLVLEPEH